MSLHRAQLASQFDVPDGGRYLNDWTSRVDAVLAAHATLVAENERLQAALRDIAEDANEATMTRPRRTITFRQLADRAYAALSAARDGDAKVSPQSTQQEGTTA